mmetsp:Transcript_7805/g.19045  ORF Transcript_7805/g.19045 Transcript_7805/m.19045 type:complete len:369 (+) Transcript_7805:547-1653(+)
MQDQVHFLRSLRYLEIFRQDAPECWVREEDFRLISGLHDLRWLLIDGTAAKKLPAELSDLQYLQFLRIEKSPLQRISSDWNNLGTFVCEICPQLRELPDSFANVPTVTVRGSAFCESPPDWAPAGACEGPATCEGIPQWLVEGWTLGVEGAVEDVCANPGCAKVSNSFGQVDLTKDGYIGFAEMQTALNNNFQGTGVDAPVISESGFACLKSQLGVNATDIPRRMYIQRLLGSSCGQCGWPSVAPPPRDAVAAACSGARDAPVKAMAAAVCAAGNECLGPCAMVQTALAAGDPQQAGLLDEAQLRLAMDTAGLGFLFFEGIAECLHSLAVCDLGPPGTLQPGAVALVGMELYALPTTSCRECSWAYWT